MILESILLGKKACNIEESTLPNVVDERRSFPALTDRIPITLLVVTSC